MRWLVTLGFQIRSALSYESEAGAAPAEEVEDSGREPMLKLISQLTAAQKVALAIRGNAKPEPS